MRLLRALFVCTLLVGGGLADTALGQGGLSTAPQNPDFEAGAVDAPPAGWFFSGKDATASIEGTGAFAGQQCVRLDSRQASGERLFTNLMQSLDATPWRGKRVRFGAAAKVDELQPGTTVNLWLRVDRPRTQDGQAQTGAFDNMSDRPIRDTEWTVHQIVLDVADDAQRIALGMFVTGKGLARFDAVTFEVVGNDVPTTGGARASARSAMHPAVAKALGEAEDAPQQPFFSLWLLLPAAALALFVLGAWRLRAPDATTNGVPTEVGALRTFALRFSLGYWLLYCLPGPFDDWIALAWSWLGRTLDTLFAAGERAAATWTAHHILGIEGELVPPNGSGDTTQNYVAVLVTFVLAMLIAAACALWRRHHGAHRHEVLADLQRSYLRYVLAAAMLGYGLAKVSLTHNQFAAIGERQLERTWGDSSPMGVVWSFMGASRPYTIFAGLGEVLGAALLIWRRTATLGALVTIGVMTNVSMLNYCYDVPVKLYSTHLLVMAAVIVMPDVPRLFDALVRGRATQPQTTATLWQRPRLRRIALALKVVIIAAAFAWPIGARAFELLTHESTGEARANDTHRLTTRGFRWINEVPFNR